MAPVGAMALRIVEDHQPLFLLKGAVAARHRAHMVIFGGNFPVADGGVGFADTFRPGRARDQ